MRMRHTETSHPSRAFTAPEREASVEVLILIHPDTALPPGETENLLQEVVDRTDRALAGIFNDLRSHVRVDDIGISGPRHVPVFPVNIGGGTYQVSTDVYEAIDRLRQGTPLEGLAYDSAGRAFNCSVWCAFRRVPEADRPVSEVWTLEGPTTADGPLCAEDG